MNTLDDAVARHINWPEHTLFAGQTGTLEFRPSKDESHAAVALDRIAAQGWAVTTFTSGWHDKTQIRCCIMRAPDGPAVVVVAETRPLAICRAFVQAMERWGDG